MTGFAREAAETPFGTMTCELRAVNHRFLDVQFRLPEELRPKEIELRAIIGEAIKRGKVECSLHLRRGGNAGSELTLNEALVKQLATRTGEIKSVIPDTAALNPLDILRWPGVVAEPEIDTDPLYEAAMQVIGNALEAMASMRSSEGQRIAQMIDSRLDEVFSIAANRAKQQERIDKLDVDADPARLETELALIAQKLDVDEEIDRLESHVSEVRAALHNDEPVGRRLDFLMQELNREANTLGSKSADTDTTRAAVDLKVLIEQMREQIQNIE
jgi:uncharacterized protein (TIGR00255 family)